MAIFGPSGVLAAWRTTVLEETMRKLLHASMAALMLAISPIGFSVDAPAKVGEANVDRAEDVW
jgi:hypothetical protein